MKENVRFTPRLVVFKPPINKSDEIAELITLAKDESSKSEKQIDFGAVPNHQAQIINQKTAVKTNGFIKTLSREAVSHVLKGHGDNKAENERGQKGVTDNDFQLLPTILVEPDNIEYGGKNRFGQESIKFIKKINNDTYFVVMCVKNKKAELSFSTMYIKR